MSRDITDIDGFETETVPSAIPIDFVNGFKSFPNDQAYWDAGEITPIASDWGAWYFNTTTNKLRYYDGDCFIEVPSGTNGIHFCTHSSAKQDEADGDHVDIDFNPVNYSVVTGSPGTDPDHLAAHLRGIDTGLGFPVPSHQGTHLSGGSDQVDGDLLDVDFSPANYSPAIGKLTSHLTAIDAALIGGVVAHAGSHLSGQTDEIDGDLLNIDYSPTNYVAGGMTLADHLTGIDTALTTAEAHAINHDSLGSDEIDGDVLDIDFSPTNYIPDTSPPEVTLTQELTAHLKGIDTLSATQSLDGTFTLGTGLTSQTQATTAQYPLAVLTQADTYFCMENMAVWFNGGGGQQDAELNLQLRNGTGGPLQDAGQRTAIDHQFSTATDREERTSITVMGLFVVPNLAPNPGGWILELKVALAGNRDLNIFRGSKFAMKVNQ